MRQPLQPLIAFFTSLRLTVVLLALSIVLVFWATLAQVHYGVWVVQERFFQSFFVVKRIPGTAVAVPVFPGGYLIGGLLLINLVVSHIYRFKLTWRKAGIWLIHAGLILLLLGELFTGLWQVQSSMDITTGRTKDYSESYHQNELAVIDATDPNYDEVVSIPESFLASGREIQNPRLPFIIRPVAYYPNAIVQMRSQVPNAPPSPATVDIGTQLAVRPAPLTFKENDRNLPAAYIELDGPDGPLGTWLVSAILSAPQSFNYQGHTWRLALRYKRYYYPFSLTLLKFSNDLYPGSDIARNYSSKVRLRSDDGHEDRNVLIYMNHPLRYDGFTFYQQSFSNDNRTSILQVVRNPSWVIPYVSCVMMALGMILQFGMHLFGFFRRRRAAAARA